MKNINNKGQVTIEFLFSFLFAGGIVVLFLYYALNYTAGYLAHYATFQASRTFLTHDSGNEPRNALELAKESAVNEFLKYPLKEFGIFYKENGVEINLPGGQVPYEFVGAYFGFKNKLSLGEKTEKNDFLSESFLGKEPLRSNCECQVIQALGFQCVGETAADIRADVTVFDNGC